MPGTRKIFENDFTQSGNAVFLIKPAEGRKLQLIEIRFSFKDGTTEDRHWVFEIGHTAPPAIIHQKYYKNFAQLMTQADNLQIKGALIILTFNFPAISDPNLLPMELIGDMYLKIYTTNEEMHDIIPDILYAPYNELTDKIGGPDPFAYMVLETSSVKIKS
ncbi:MAG: hypothetical protein QXP66_01850 [Candidatus Aenigmatarchaeota archaeon]